MNQKIMRHINPITIFTLAIMALPGILAAESFSKSVSREFSADSLQGVDLQAYSGSVSVTGWSEARIVVDIELTANASNQEAADKIIDKAELTFDEVEGVLQIAIKNKGKSRSWFGIRGQSKSVKAKISVMVPESMNLQVNTGSGSVYVEEISSVIDFNSGSGSVKGSNLSGEIKASTGSGGVRLDNVSGEIIADTGSGSIDINDMEGSLVASTGSGGIKVSGQINQFSAKTGSGSIEIESSVELLEDSKAATGSGGVTITIPQSSGFVLKAGCVSGSISCDFDLVDPIVKKRSLKGATRKDGPEISIGTGSGSINVRHP